MTLKKQKQNINIQFLNNNQFDILHLYISCYFLTFCAPVPGINRYPALLKIEIFRKTFILNTKRVVT